MTEPDVTLTDFALALECAVFCALVIRWPASDPRMRRSWAILFGSVGVSSLLGAIVHGWFAAGNSWGYALLWALTLLCLGVTSTAMWMIGSYVLLDETTGTTLRRVSILLLTIYSTIVLFVSQRFLVAIAMYLPAAVFLLVACVKEWRRSGDGALRPAIAGLVLTFIAAAIQQLRIGIHPAYFNHNALYHVVQAGALFLIFLGARALTSSSREPVSIAPVRR